MSRRRLQSFDDFKRALKGKYGLGEGENYKPWLRVQDVPSEGVRSQISGLKTFRTHHMMSSLETELFYLVEFHDSVTDIREQFPLIPIELSIKISKLLSIKHPEHPKTKTPLILTTDLLLTKSVNGIVEYEAISVKPKKELSNLRVLEKLEIERVWWELLDIPYSIYSGSDVLSIRSRNISWITDPLRTAGITYSKNEILIALSTITTGKQLICDICNGFIHELDIGHDEALVLMRVLIAKKFLIVDMEYLLEEAKHLIVTEVVRVQEGVRNVGS